MAGLLGVYTGRKGLLDTLDEEDVGLLGKVPSRLGMTPHSRMKATQRAFAEQFDRETPQDYPVVERSSLFPLATYANGQTGLALPGLIAEDIPNALTAPSRAYMGELGDYADNRDAYLSEGLNFAGTAAVGGSVVPRPGGALATNNAKFSNWHLEALGMPPDWQPTPRPVVDDLVKQMRHWVNILDQTDNAIARGAVERRLADLKARYDAEVNGTKYTPPKAPRSAGPASIPRRQLEALNMPPDWKPGNKGEGDLFANSTNSSLPGTLLSEAADQAPHPLTDVMRLYGVAALPGLLGR